MKRLLIVPILVALSLLICGAESYYINTGADSCIALLDEAEKSILDKDSEQAFSIAGRIEKRFRGQSGVFNVFMYHSEVSHIASDIAMLRQYARTGNISDFLATSACARRELEAVKHAKALSWDNIF